MTAPTPMKTSFSIRAKLIAIVMSTTCVALILAGGALAAFQIRSHRAALERELATVADVVGQNLPAALIFEKADSAEKALHPLDSQPDVVSACLYDGAGRLFAKYIRAGYREPCPARPEPEIAGFLGQILILYHPVVVSGQSPGTLRMVASLGDLQRRIRIFGLVLLLVLSGAALAALVLSSGLQRLVSGPILELTSTAQKISQNHDYSLRAPQRTHDELGIAVDAFNQMLDRIAAAVSERKRAEEALMALNATLEERVAERTAKAEQQAAELKRSNEELERFASVASHDLQEPLRAVASYTQLLKQRFGPAIDPETELYLGHVLTGAGRMRALINDLLDYARVGRGTLSRAMVDSGAVLDGALADLSTALAESGAEVTRGPLPTLPANPGKLGQLLRNLITNAIRFKGDAPPHIDVRCERKGDVWEFAVRDNGIGIEPKHHERIFVIFQRLHGRDRPGTGIGLAICRKIVELHGGTIWVDSAPDQGSTFHFTLPATLNDHVGD
jgi:signal transduction histidine kinase